MGTLKKYQGAILHCLNFKGETKRSDLKKYVIKYHNLIEFDVISFNLALVKLLGKKEIKEFKDSTFKKEETYKIKGGIK